MATKVITDDPLKQIGNTPLLKLDSLSNEKVTYFAKLEGHNLRATYDEWLQAAETLTAQLSDDGKKQIFGGTAQRFYRL